jgi:hypothetical protein
MASTLARLRAKNKVKNEVRRGRMPHVSSHLCACGRQAQVYHHHLGYAPEHWLDVTPECKSCHAKDHRMGYGQKSEDHRRKIAEGARQVQLNSWSDPEKKAIRMAKKRATLAAKYG